MNYSDVKRIAFLEEIVATQTEQINRLQQCMNQIICCSDMSIASQDEIVDMMCGDDDELMVDRRYLFHEKNKCTEEKKREGKQTYNEKDRNMSDGLDEKNGDFYLTQSELVGKYGKLELDERTGEFSDILGVVRRIGNVQANKDLAYDMANNKVRVGDGGGVWRTGVKGDIYDHDSRVWRTREENDASEYGDIALTWAELEEKYGKLTFSEEHKDFYDADGFVRRICNISKNEYFASNMAKGEMNINDA
jgi:hypothetical protein